jgi:hypothetical protein
MTQQQVVIEKNPEVDDNIVVLDRHETMAGYASTYGDRIAEWYEDHKLIVVPFWPIDADLEYLQGLTMPASFAKAGSFNGIDRPLYERKGNALVSMNPLTSLKADVAVQVYLRDQISGIYSQLRKALPLLFPRYSLQEVNITFRYTPTSSEGILHLDVFKATSDMHRVKLFLNMDSDYRVWTTSYDLLRILEVYKERFQDISPDIDRNTLNKLVNERVGGIVPRHTLRYPGLSCVIGNGETVLHEVVSGNRMIAMEYRTTIDSMLKPEKYIGTVLPKHMRDLGYSPQARQTA